MEEDIYKYWKAFEPDGHNAKWLQVPKNELEDIKIDFNQDLLITRCSINRMEGSNDNALWDVIAIKTEVDVHCINGVATVTYPYVDIPKCLDALDEQLKEEIIHD